MDFRRPRRSFCFLSFLVRVADWALIAFVSKPYIPHGGSGWRINGASVAPFTLGSPYQLESPDIPKQAIAHVRDDHLHQLFGDFDDHLEDVSIGMS